MQHRIESLLASAIRALLDDAETAADLQPGPKLDEVASVLQRFVPEALGNTFEVWHTESLDGVLPCYCRKIGPLEVELGGACWVLSTQSLAPLWLRLTIDAHVDSVVAADVKLGARGDGPMGLRQHDSREANRFQFLFRDEADRIDWAFSATMAR